MVDFLKGFGTDAFADVHHHRGIEKVLAQVFVQPEEVSEGKVKVGKAVSCCMVGGRMHSNGLVVHFLR
jgi:hypothetical protein